VVQTDGTYIYHYAMKTEISLIDISGLTEDNILTTIHKSLYGLE